MFRILDRYLVREIALPLGLGLLVLTFVLMMPPILKVGEQLIAKGVDFPTVIRALLTLMPQALSVTIPMAVLLGILVGLGRLSADREFVALQACGVSVFRVLRPIGVLAILGTAATAYETIVALPDANQTFREITLNVIASWAETDIKPRVFFTNFPNRVIYVRDIEPDRQWRDIFLADTTRAGQTTVYLARRGRLEVDRAKRRVELVLEDGRRHTTFTSATEDYEGSSFPLLVLTLDADAIFPRTQVIKGDNEMTIAELRATVADNANHGASSASQLFTIQQKFSLPVACLVLSLIGVALGVSNRKDGKLASFALGFGVVFVYYVLLYSSRAMALGGRMSPTLAPWVVNLVLGVAGVALVVWRAGAADRPLRISLPAWPRTRAPHAPARAAEAASRRGKTLLVVRLPHVHWPRPRLLDVYVSRQYLAIFALAFGSLVGIFYISTFIDMADKLFRGAATTRLLLRYFYFATPQYVYYIIPLAALLATLVTIGLLTKNSELIVMRACGVSLYRSAVPLVLFAVAFSGVLFELQERVLVESNLEAARLNGIIRGYPMQEFGVLNRRWIVGTRGDIYTYEFFNPQVNQFREMRVMHVNDATWTLDALTYAKETALVRHADVDGQPAFGWVARQGWTREFSTALGDDRSETTRVAYAPFAERGMSLEPPEYFKTDEPEADRMTYGQLKRYVAQLQASGYHVVPYIVQLQRKVAFPFVTLIMTLLAVPFAVTTGSRGALYGIGVGIALAIVYWTTLSVFGALGAGGWVSPVLAAWAPNLLFGAAALYMILTIRT
ncbi:MAG: LptF/LptG family permease [Acidobacteria bacterium]|nr:LptF/LptG family permease [Acidobacteriota bacterium]